jgi:hypothetical protein
MRKCPFIIFFMLLAKLIAADPHVYVFYPSPQRSNTIEKKLMESCRGLRFTVFGKQRDFMRKLTQSPPDAVLTKPALVEKGLPDFSIFQNGYRAGRAKEALYLLAVGSAVTPGDLDAQSVLGVIDYLGRKEMTAYVKSIIPTGPKTKRVTKVEDLLSLLTFKMVKAVLVTEEHLAHLKKISQLDFKETKLPKVELGIISLAIKKDADAAVIKQAMAKMPESISGLLGVSEWK